MAKFSDQVKNLPDRAAGAAVEQVTHHKAAVAGAVVGGLTLGPVGAVAGAAMGESLARFRSGLQAESKKPSELAPELAVKDAKETGFWGRVAEKLPKIAEITTGVRPAPESAPKALAQIRGEMAYAKVIIKINSLSPAERQRTLNQLLESGKISTYDEAAAMYALLDQEIRYQQSLQQEQAQKIERLIPEIQAQQKEAEDYHENVETPEVKADRAQREARVEAYDLLIVNLAKAAKSKQGEQAVLRIIDEARGLLDGRLEGSQATDLQMAHDEVGTLYTLLSAPTPDQAAIEAQLPNFQARLTERNKEARANYKRLQKENEPLIASLRQGEAKVDEAAVAAEMPDEWRAAKEKYDQAEQALVGLRAHPPNTARITLILNNHEASAQEITSRYQTEYNAIKNNLGKGATKAKIEAEMDKDFRADYYAAQKDLRGITKARSGLAGHSKDEGIAYLKSIQKDSKAEMDEHKAKYEKAKEKHTNRQRRTDAEIAQEIGGDYAKAFGQYNETSQTLAIVESWQSGRLTLAEFVPQLEAAVSYELTDLGSQRDLAFAKRDVKQATTDTTVLRYLDQVEAHIKDQKGKTLQRSVEANLRNINHSRNEESQKLEEFKSDPEKELEKLKAEKAQAQERLTQSKKAESANEVPYRDMIQYVEKKWGTGFMSAVNERINQLTVVREDMVAVNEAANQLKGETPEDKKNLAQGLVAKRAGQLEDLAHASEADLRSFARELRAAGIEIEDEDEAIETMKSIGRASSGRSLFGIFANLLQSLVATPS